MSQAEISEALRAGRLAALLAGKDPKPEPEPSLTLLDLTSLEREEDDPLIAGQDDPDEGQITEDELARMTPAAIADALAAGRLDSLLGRGRAA
jgi:hypothetical protein